MCLSQSHRLGHFLNRINCGSPSPKTRLFWREHLLRRLALAWWTFKTSTRIRSGSGAFFVLYGENCLLQFFYSKERAFLSTTSLIDNVSWDALDRGKTWRISFIFTVPMKQCDRWTSNFFFFNNQLIHEDSCVVYNVNDHLLPVVCFLLVDFVQGFLFHSFLFCGSKSYLILTSCAKFPPKFETILS